MPGQWGPGTAFLAEFLISAVLMLMVLSVSSSPRFARFTGLTAGCLVALYITLESPLSGMSMNPARSFASAAPGMQWRHLWIYFTAPVAGMLGGAEVFLALRGASRIRCAKLLHPPEVRCIHCGHEPRVVATDPRPSPLDPWGINS
jgi:aquaporin Z